MTANNRYSDWVRGSVAAVRFEKFLVVTIQMLGRLDCHLIEEDGRFVGLPSEDREG